MNKLKNKKTANSSTAVACNSGKKRPDELVLDIDCRKKQPKDDDTIRYISIYQSSVHYGALSFQFWHVTLNIYIA